MSEKSISWAWIALSAMVIFTVALCVYHAEFFCVGAFGDEVYYLAAAREVLAGGDARDVFGWYYPNMFAAAFAAIARACGEQGLLYAFRGANGVGVAVWIAFCAEVLVSCTKRRWMPVYIFCMFCTRMVQDSFDEGNIGGVLFLPLAFAIGARNGMVRALFLALSCTLKPYGLGVVLGRKWWEMAPALLVVLALHAGGGSGHLPFVTHAANGSFARGFAVLGIPWQVPVALALSGALLFGRGSWSRGVCFSWLALPIVWGHTSLMLLFPLVCAFGYWLSQSPSQKQMPGVLARIFVLIVVNHTTRFLPLECGGFWNFLFSEVPAGAVVLLLFLTRDPPSLRR